MVGPAEKMTPDQEIQVAKERLRAALRQVSSDVQHSADSLQERVVDTLQEAQDRVQQTTDHIGAQVSQAVATPLEAIRKRPLEAVGTALIAGLVVGLLTQGQAETQPPASPRSPTPHPSDRGSKIAGLASGFLASGLGKAVTDVVREEYLTPENVRNWVRGLLKKPKEESWVKESPSSPG